MDDGVSYSLSGEYLKIYKAFLNLVYKPILVEMGLENEIETLKNLVIEVLLKNPVVLNDIWKSLKNGQ